MLYLVKLVARMSIGMVEDNLLGSGTENDDRYANNNIFNQNYTSQNFLKNKLAL